MGWAALSDFAKTESFGIFLGAFFGAFFAFAFTRLGTLRDRLFARKQKHRTALVGIEKQGNEYQNFIGDNLFVANDYITIAKECVSNNQSFLYFNELHELPIDKSLGLALGNIDLVNDLFSLEASVVKVNSSMRSLNKYIATMEQAFVNKNIHIGAYLTNVQSIMSKFAEIQIFLHDLETENKDLMARTRVLIKSGDRSFYTLLLGRVMRKKFTKRQLEQVPSELKKLNEEIDETKSTDRKRIDKLLKLTEKGSKERNRYL